MTSDGINSFATNKRGKGLENPVRTYIYIMFLVAVKLSGDGRGKFQMYRRYNSQI